MSEDQVRAFLDRWRSAGAALEDHRALDLQQLDDETARRRTTDLFELWRPDLDGDEGQELLLHQHVFGRWRERNAAGASGGR